MRDIRIQGPGASLAIPVACPCVLWFWFWLCFYPSSVPPRFLLSFFFLTETTGGHKAGGLAPVCQPRLHSSSCWGYGMSPDRQHTIHTHTHTYTCTHTFSHTLAVSIQIPRCRRPAECIIHPFCQSLSLPVFQPSTAAASTLATLLLACPARFQGSSCQVGAPYCRPQFSSYSCRVARYGRYEPVRRGSGPSLQHPYRIRAVRCWAVHTPTHTRTCAATPTSSLFYSGPRRARMTRGQEGGRSRSTAQDSHGRMAQWQYLEYTYLLLLRLRPRMYLPIYRHCPACAGG